MAEPGWYPDPAGGSGLRYWDGAAWAELEQLKQPRRFSGPVWWIVGSLVAVLVVLLALVQPWNSLPRPIVEDTNSSRPTITGWDETTRPSEPPDPTSTSIPEDGGGRPVACPPGNGVTIAVGADGRYHSGGMSFRAVPGWGDSRGYALDWANDTGGQHDRVTPGWVSLTAIGWLPIEHFPSPRAAVRQVVDCLSTSFYYKDLDRREVLSSAEYSIGGHPGWLMRVNLWNRQPHDVLGDEIIVLVADTGQPDGLAVFHAEAPIGDSRRIALINAALDSIELG